MKKTKLITSLCMLVLTLACLTFGVYSAVKTSFTASGTITFNAYSVECDVAIKIVGAEGGDRVLYATTNKANASAANITQQIPFSPNAVRYERPTKNSVLQISTKHPVIKNQIINISNRSNISNGIRI